MTHPRSRSLRLLHLDRRFLVGAAIALSYVVLACVVYWPIWPFDGRHVIDEVGGDPIQEVWFLDWTRFAIFHGHNPFVTHYLNAPSGANLALNTSFPLLGILAAPITATLGPIAAYNMLLRLALATSAFACYLVLRRYTTWRPAAYLGGLLFGFSPYMIGHSHRHLFLTFVPLVPLVIPVVDEWLVRARANPWRAGALLGLLSALEYLISPEICLATVLFVVFALLGLAVRYRKVVRDRLGNLWRGLITAGVVFGALAGYPAWLLLRGPDRPIGAIHSVASLDNYRGDLLAPVMGTKGEALTPTRMATVGNRLVHHSVTENGFYLGVILVVLLAYLVVRAWRSSIVLAATVGGLAAFVLGLGNELTFDNHKLLSGMPFAVFGKLPVLQNFEAARFSLYMQLGAAIVLAVGLDVVRRNGWRLRRPADEQAARSAKPWLVALVGVVALVPLVPALPLVTGRAHIPKFFTTSAVKQVPQGALALTFPFDRSPQNDAMLWQAASKMRFRIFGGEMFVPGVNGKSTFLPSPPTSPNIDSVLLAGTHYHPGPPTDTAASIAALREYCVHYGVGVVFVDPQLTHAPELVKILTKALGQAPLTTGGMETWLNVQADLSH
jgi:hypothetical protein